jgi:hypothetical protein
LIPPVLAPLAIQTATTRACPETGEALPARLLMRTYRRVRRRRRSPHPVSQSTADSFAETSGRPVPTSSLYSPGTRLAPAD